jgi:hypothetical protein
MDSKMARSLGNYYFEGCCIYCDNDRGFAAGIETTSLLSNSNCRMRSWFEPMGGFAVELALEITNSLAGTKEVDCLLP